jgi:hypothetical protein
MAYRSTTLARRLENAIVSRLWLALLCRSHKSARIDREQRIACRARLLRGRDRVPYLDPGGAPPSSGIGGVLIGVNFDLGAFGCHEIQ